MLFRTSIPNAICNHYYTKIKGTYNSNNTLIESSNGYHYSFQNGVNHNKLRASCVSNFPKNKFLEARGLPEKTNIKHYEQIKDMMSLCGGVNKYKVTPTHQKDGSLYIEFYLESSKGTLSEEGYNNYQQCLIDSLDHPLIKTATQPEAKTKPSSPKPQ